MQTSKTFCTYIVILLWTLFFSTACSTTRKTVVSESSERDSVVISYVTETTYVTDTTWIELPAQKAERTTLDSCSHLTNDYAESTAKINPDGTLYHDLILLPKNIPKTFEKPVVKKTKDTNTKKRKTETKTVTVEKPIPLSTRILAFLGKFFIVFLIISILIYIFKHKK